MAVGATCAQVSPVPSIQATEVDHVGLPNRGRITNDKRPCTAHVVLQLIILRTGCVVQLKTSVSRHRNQHCTTKGRERVMGLLLHYRTFRAYGG